MLAPIHDNTWNVLNMQHIPRNSKDGIIQTSPVVAIKKIKGPAHMAEGGHHLRKAPKPQPRNDRLGWIAIAHNGRLWIWYGGG